MNDPYLIVVLAIGTGISLGWLLKAWHGKLNPDGILKLSESMATINAGIREDAKRSIADERARSEEFRTIAYNDATYWREHAQRLAMNLSPQPLPLRAPTPPPVGKNGTTNGHLDENQKKLFDLCISKGMTSDAALSIARGETDGLPPDPMLDEIAAVAAQDDSGAV